MQFTQKNVNLNLKEAMLVDTGATFSLFCDPKFDEQTQQVPTGTNVRTNIGSRRINNAGSALGFKSKVWVDELRMANALSFANVVD